MVWLGVVAICTTLGCHRYEAGTYSGVKACEAAMPSAIEKIAQESGAKRYTWAYRCFHDDTWDGGA